MPLRSSNSLSKFQDLVDTKFQLFNSLFLSLPFDRIEKTGILLSLFLSNCVDGYEAGRSPSEIVENFFDNHTSTRAEKERIDLLFRFIQYAERQVVLFDALEDAAFAEINDLQGSGTLRHLESAVLDRGKQAELNERLRDFYVRLVLTAHPTQFYPSAVLGIINDLTEMIGENDIGKINTYLQQLGKTPFIKKKKPTPFDEAVSLIWYLENVFYDAAGNIAYALKNYTPDDVKPIRMGFWSGGDRDGNPFVRVDTTLKVAESLRNAILRCYYADVRRLKRRLTFAGVEPLVAKLEQKLYESLIGTSEASLSKEDILAPLRAIRQRLETDYNSLFIDRVDNLVCRVDLFGLYFASLDIRQDSRIHEKVMDDIAAAGGLPNDYASKDDGQKIDILTAIRESIDADKFEDELVKDTLLSVQAVKTIQKQNGEHACERYIISQCKSALNAIEVYGLFLLGGWKAKEITVDIVPLFETITDLKNAPDIMRALYRNNVYREHLTRRANVQTIMLGFSDGTKDGGYLMANWSIYKAKDELTRVSKEHGVTVVFFDGRGGPPARGGGKTHKFFSSMGKNVSDKAIELTIQGQTVSSNFATVDAAQYNIEQLLHAGTYNRIFEDKTETFTGGEGALVERLAGESYNAYLELKNHPLFLDYLLHVSPLPFYSETNIGSRPAKRGNSSELRLEDLRAIPFVGAWSQLKQNVPGFYGVGSALKALDYEQGLEAITALYSDNSFFKALMDNCEMAMEKCDFSLTRFLAGDPEFGEFWNKIHDEFELTRRYLFLISGKTELMEDHPVEKRSIQTRERIMLPLTTIQQFALRKNREPGGLDNNIRAAYEKLIIRCSFGIINAGRNSV